MNANSSELNVSIQTIEINAKKITRTILDQTPRLDICDILVNKHCVTNLFYKLNPICRFSLSTLFESEKRVSKKKGHPAQQIKNLIREYETEDEGFFFMHNNAIHCSSYSSKYASKLYGEKAALMDNKIEEYEKKIKKVEKVLKLLNKGASLKEAANHYHRKVSEIITGPKKIGSKTLKEEDLIAKYGSSKGFKDAIQSEIWELQKDSDLLVSDLDYFHTKTSLFIDEIKETPFVFFDF